MLSRFLATKIYNMKLTDEYAHEIIKLICQPFSNLDPHQFAQSGGMQAIFKAIENGVPDILVEIAKANENLLWSTTDPESSKNMFVAAISHRQEKVARFLFNKVASKETNIIFTRDEDKNNTLHLAAMLSPPSQLVRISGAALQLQSELRWFKAVEGIAPRFYIEEKNKDGEIPFQVFVREHTNLLKEAEEWIKKTAESSTVVAALIVTIMFAVAFTLPGGNNQESGIPLFLSKKPVPFKVFIVSDAISLFAASGSVLMFLGILTSRYAYEDFLESLPRKLIIGLCSLFISIATMMTAFCVALFIMLRGELWMVIPISLLAGVPVTFFLWLQSPLLVEIYALTFSPDIFDRNIISERSFFNKLMARVDSLTLNNIRFGSIISADFDFWRKFFEVDEVVI